MLMKMKGTKIIFDPSRGILIEYEEICLEIITLTKTVEYMAKLYIYTHRNTYTIMHIYKVVEKKCFW